MHKFELPGSALWNPKRTGPFRGWRNACPALLVALTLGLLFGAARLQAGILNTNLVFNGGAETGVGDAAGGPVPSIPGWTTNGGTFTVVQYGCCGFPLLTDPGPPNRGTNFFGGGEGGVVSSAYQNIDVSSAAAVIDSGAVAGVLSGWLGGYDSQADDAELTATFLDTTGATTLGSLSIGPVSPIDRTNNTALLFRQAATPVPAGTRTVQILLTLTRFEGNFNDGYADNLSFILQSAPRLQIAGPGTSVKVTWPTNANAWHLQSTTAASGGWTNLPAASATVGTNFVVTISATSVQQFFRLTYP